MSRSEVPTHCPECNGRVRAGDTEIVCEACGLVVGEDPIDPGPEWRSFDDGRRGCRTGAPLTRSRHDRGLSTEIGFGGNGVRLTGRKRRRIARMRREHKRAQIPTKAERNQVYAFHEIKRLTSALSLGETIHEQSCALFDTAQSENLLCGRSIEGFAAAAVYATCRLNGVARAVDEIVVEAVADEGELKAAYDALNRELGLPLGPIDLREYLPRFACALDASPAVESRARELATAMREEGLDCGRNPCGVAAACLYAAAQEEGTALTQAEAAEVGGVSPVTLRSAYYDLCEAVR